MQVIAHRGACQEALENSWQAFQKAIELGADRIELDVQLSLDNQLVVIHDETLDRVCLQSGKIPHMTRSELSKVRLKNQEPLPFLDQVISDILPQVELNIEIKPAGTKIVDLTMEMLIKANMTKRAVVSSFHHETVLHLAKYYPTQRAAYLWCRSWVWPWQIQQHPQKVIPQLPTTIIHPDAKLVTPRFMKVARRRQWQVFPYISIGNEQDRERVWQKLYDLQVDGHCTNFPREMIAWLKEKDIAPKVASVN
ncbi:MAG: glycerophosphodiester phosphodiesterase [Oligoflexus sp.]